MTEQRMKTTYTDSDVERVAQLSFVSEALSAVQRGHMPVRWKSLPDMVKNSYRQQAASDLGERLTWVAE